MEDEKSLPYGKDLASSDKKTRDKAVKRLASFLSDSTDTIPKAEMAKLWKGVFYCFWMSDKPLVQQALALDLAEILLGIPTVQGSLDFLRGFWEAIVREWSRIDRLRIDKYYLLIRRFVNASVRLLYRNEWDADLVKQYNSILTERGGPLCPTDIRIPTSLTYHLSDIYLDELNKISGGAPVASPLPTPLIALLNPFLDVAAHTPNKTTYQRIQSSLIDPLLDALTPAALESEEEDEDEEPARKRRKTSSEYEALLANVSSVDPRKEGAISAKALRKTFLQRIFDIASLESTRDSNRRKLYAVWKSNADDDGEDEDRPPDATSVIS